MQPRPHLFLATPCFGGLVTQGYMQSVLALMQHAPAAGFDLSLGLLGHDALITRSRSTLLARFRASPASHLLFVDADISFGPEQVDRLLASGKELVAGIYPLKTLHWDHRALARAAAGEPLLTAPMLYVGQPCTGAELVREGDLVTAVHAGTGFMLIARVAVERLVAAYPQTRYRAIHAWPLPPGPAEDAYALFDSMIAPDTLDYLSEDYSFCRRWRDIGGQVWLDTAGRLTHAGGFDFAGDPARRFAQTG